MKRSVLTVILAIAATALSQARSNVLEREMEDYARDLVRAQPKVCKEDEKTREARQRIFNEAKNAKLLDLSKVQEKKLRKREALITDGVFKNTLDKMKALNSKDPEVTFLIQYAEKEKINAAEKTLAHRLLENRYQKAAQQAAQERGKRMHAIMQKYSDYKQANGKAPASLGDLELPEELKQFTDPATGKKHDWIYLGHLGPALKTGSSYVVLAEPLPNGEARACGLDNGEIVRFKNSAIEGHLNKLQKAIKDGTAKPGQPAGGNTGGGGHPSQPHLVSLMKKYMAYKKANDGKAPSSLNDLDLTADEKQYTSPASGEKADWIFLGSNSKISVGNGVKVVVCAPKASGGIRLIGLSDGRVGTIKDSNISKHLP